MSILRKKQRSFFIDFVEQCLGHNEESPHETLPAIRERTDLSREDATKLYLVYSLSAREPLWYVVDQCCGMKDVIQAYYDPTALMCDDMFVMSRSSGASPAQYPRMKSHVASQRCPRAPNLRSSVSMHT